MQADTKRKILSDLYNAEVLHHEVYFSFSKSERSSKVKADMAELAKLENYHATLWAEMLKLSNAPIPKQDRKMAEFWIMLCRRVLGLALTIKIIEHTEQTQHQKLDEFLKHDGLTSSEKRVLQKIKSSEEGREDRLESKIVEYNPFFNNIRDAMFGMNDGLVELLAVVAGLAAALHTPIIIFIAGFIVAISGTLSMAVGAYISTDYQKDIGTKMKKGSREMSAKSSAFYVGIFYLIGSLFPLSPFILGLPGYVGIAAAVIITAIILTLTSSIIAVVSDKSVIRNVSKTLLLSLGAAVATILLGAYVRATFHITI